MGDSPEVKIKPGANLGVLDSTRVLGLTRVLGSTRALGLTKAPGSTKDQTRVLDLTKDLGVTKDQTKVPDSTKDQAQDSVEVQTQALVRFPVQTTTNKAQMVDHPTMVTQPLPHPVLMLF